MPLGILVEICKPLLQFLDNGYNLLRMLQKDGSSIGQSDWLVSVNQLSLELGF